MGDNKQNGGGWLDSVADFFAGPGSDYGGPASGIAGAFESAGKVAGPIGIGLSGASAAANAYKLGKDVGRDGAEGAFHDQNAYNHAAGAAMGAAGAILPFAGPYGQIANAALTGAQVTANVGGAATGWAFGDKASYNANSVAGGLLRGTYGDQSMGWQASQQVSKLFGHNVVGDIAAGGTGALVNNVMMPTNLAITGGRMIGDQWSKNWDAIQHGDGAIGGAVHNIGTGIGNAAHAAGETAGNVVKNAGGAMTSTVSSVMSW